MSLETLIEVTKKVSYEETRVNESKFRNTRWSYEENESIKESLDTLVKFTTEGRRKIEVKRQGCKRFVLSSKLFYSFHSSIMTDTKDFQSVKWLFQSDIDWRPMLVCSPAPGN